MTENNEDQQMPKLHTPFNSGDALCWCGKNVGHEYEEDAPEEDGDFDDDNPLIEEDSSPEEPLRVSEPIPLIMTRKNDKVVIGSAVVTVYEDRAEILGTFGDSEEAGEAAGLFSSNIIGGISLGAVLSPEAASKISKHLKS